MNYVIHKCNQIHETIAHPDVSYICPPYLIRSIYGNISQQIRVYQAVLRPFR